MTGGGGAGGEEELHPVPAPEAEERGGRSRLKGLKTDRGEGGYLVASLAHLDAQLLSFPACALLLFLLELPFDDAFASLHMPSSRHVMTRQYRHQNQGRD